MFFHRLLDIVSPRGCVVCGGRLSAREEHVCLSCQMVLPYTNMQRQPTDNAMVRRFFGQFAVCRAAALMRFVPQTPPARLVYAIKYGDGRELAVWIGRWMAAICGPDFFSGIEGITYVPLTPKRERWRGYNQCRLLARGISQHTGLPLLDGLLLRNSFSVSQTQRRRSERMEAVEEVFSLADGADFGGRHLLLVDDVMTTGATLISCGRQLEKAGCRHISVLTLGLTGRW